MMPSPTQLIDLPASDDLPGILRLIREDLVDEYQAPHGWPWILGFSGGKDSTLLVQLVIEVVSELPPQRRQRPIHLICTDTLVEIPTISEYVFAKLVEIERAGRSLGVPIRSHRLLPELQEQFWFLLLGKGYPAPHKQFRWCTDKLKIRPSSRFIAHLAEQHDGAVLLLGSRRAESHRRAKTIDEHAVSGQRLNPHTSVSRCFIFLPIQSLLTGDVWRLLLEKPPPWGGSHRHLVSMYRNAAAGECPLVHDKSTPSCGNSRFGCWTCTVVRKDHTLEGLMEEGAFWAEALLDYRDRLIAAREDPCCRMTTRRDGRPGAGPYDLATRSRLLDDLVAVQQEVGVSLISEDEIRRIHRQWRLDRRAMDARIIRQATDVMGEAGGT
jgi:DNA sulfur modification protein DndC